MSPRVVFLDTSFVLALENKDDAHHLRAKALDDELLRDGATLLLHYGITLEIGDGFARKSRREKGRRLLERFREQEGFRIEPVTDSLHDEAVELYLGRDDKEWGLTDCVSFALMAREGIQHALTADAHFRQAGFNALLLDAE